MDVQSKNSYILSNTLQRNSTSMPPSDPELGNDSEVNLPSKDSYILSDTIQRNSTSMPPADPELGNSNCSYISRTERKLESYVHMLYKYDMHN